jgi:hypothetical protein
MQDGPKEVFVTVCEEKIRVEVTPYGKSWRAYGKYNGESVIGEGSTANAALSPA